jgi:hypothetical protein
MICGFLEAQGIRARYDKGGVVGFDPNWRGGGIGRQEILVAAADVEAAREALAALSENQA